MFQLRHGAVLAVLLLGIGGCMTSAQPAMRPHSEVATVRYQVSDVDRSLAFYTQQLGFQREHQAGTAFASVVLGRMRLLLGGPGSSGSRPLPDGRQQTPGGFNRIVIYVDDLEASIARLRQADVRFRGAIESGPGGSQIQIEDPDGNPIELHHSPVPKP
jgi:glyoxylase I family protein